MINDLIRPIVGWLPESNRYERIWKLAKVDFKKRYYNDKLGLLWALLNPVLRLAVYYFIFKYVLKNDTEHYGLFLFGGLVVWMFFTEVTKGAMRVFRQKRYLLESVQFDHMDLFYSHMLSGVLGFIFNLMAYAVFVVVSGVGVSWMILWMALVMISVILVTFGVQLIIGVLVTRLNDLSHAWDIVTLFGLWTAGVFYPAARLLEVVPWMKYVHPFVGIIENFRLVTMYSAPPNWELFLINICQGLLTYALGWHMFRKYSPSVIERL